MNLEIFSQVSQTCVPDEQQRLLHFRSLARVNEAWLRELELEIRSLTDVADVVPSSEVT